MMEQAAKRGNPSFVWRYGQERRLEMVRAHVPVGGARLLDIGCGVGMYLQAFSRYSPHVFGSEIEFDRAAQSCRILPRVAVAPAEALPFADNSFDITFLHEMIEHVHDDRQTIREACRVTRANGHIVIFAPNRWYPFETHGIFWKGRYIFGNIPLVNYLPNPLRNKLACHVRAYTGRGLRRLFEGLNVEFVAFTQIYPGFDNLEARVGGAGKVLRKAIYWAEQTPFKIFGLSHFVVARVRKE
jgi:SAM-dependent methyltransferase